MPWKSPTCLCNGSVIATLVSSGSGYRDAFRQYAEMPPEALSRDPEMWAGLTVLTRQASPSLRLVLTSVAKNDPLLQQVVEYIVMNDPNVKKEELIDVLKEIAGKGDIMQTIADMLKDEGLAEGRVEGLAEGKGKSLMRLLERRFGTLSPDVRERIAAANLDQLDRWFDLALDADSPGAVFGD